jgi:hypothetical protein
MEIPMHDPRKPIVRPDGPQQEVARDIANTHLLTATKEGAEALGCTGASFVILGVGMWISELAEVDPKAAAQMLRSLADLHDPATNNTGKLRAEKKRRSAVVKLLATLDLEMAKPVGRA